MVFIDIPLSIYAAVLAVNCLINSLRLSWSFHQVQPGALFQSVALASAASCCMAWVVSSMALIRSGVGMGFAPFYLASSCAAMFCAAGLAANEYTA
jgi:hypothetical protein